MKNRKNVLLALGWFDHRVLRGIGAYAAKNNWHLSAASITQEFIVPWGWKGDGILAWLSVSDELADFVVAQEIPTVDFSLRRKHLPFAHVVLDHPAAARMAADHFLQRGLRSFLFYSSEANWTYDERGLGFTTALREQGYDCRWLKWHEARENRASRTQWAKRRAWLMKALKAAPKPVAIFAANGTLALEVMEVCQGGGMAVPDEVAIIGVEDNLFQAQGMLLSITAVDPNLEEQGYQGAALLDRMMNGEPRPATPVRIKPARLIVRQSTEINAVAHPGVARAIEFIKEHLDKHISVDDVARHSGLSRRGLHQAFMEHLRRTPGVQIRTLRMEEAKKLLAETDNKIETIAVLSGYPSLNSFFVAFKQSCNTTPAEFRREVQRAR